jgi:hypothetical protein
MTDIPNVYTDVADVQVFPVVLVVHSAKAGLAVHVVQAVLVVHSVQTVLVT